MQEVKDLFHLIVTGRKKNKGLTFVSVTFEGDFKNCYLQAKSLSIYGNSAVSSLIIVINSLESSDIINNFKEKLKDLTNKANFDIFVVFSSDLFDFDIHSFSGNEAQQKIKIAISKFINDEYYVVMDSKNHVIKELKAEDFVEYGLAKTHEQTYYEGDPFYKCFKSAFNLVGVHGTIDIFKEYQSTTPYVLCTHIARECMNPDNILSEKPWHEFVGVPILSEGAITEFSLYAAVAEKFRYKTIHQKRNYETLFPGWPLSKREILETIYSMARYDIKFFAIHRGKMDDFSEDEIFTIANFWNVFELFDSVEEGINFIVNYNK